LHAIGSAGRAGTIDRVTTLFLLRHAKSSWADPTMSDRERPLAARGERAARRIAAYLESQRIRPELVLCSPARRTRDTLDLLQPALPRRTKVRIDDGLYGADADEIMQRLRAVDAQVGSVMVVGHNPGLEDVAMELAGDGDDAAMAQLRTKFPTAALARLELDSGWSQLGAGRAYLAALVLPRQLTE
jgi:phosphohistidine phosphatase